MSTLKDALDRIRHWFQANRLATIASLSPGLSAAEINALLSTLPFQVPQEVRELYEWSNGLDKEIFNRMSLLSLEVSVQQAKAWIEETNEEVAHKYKYIGKAILPVWALVPLNEINCPKRLLCKGYNDFEGKSLKALS